MKSLCLVVADIYHTGNNVHYCDRTMSISPRSLCVNKGEKLDRNLVGLGLVAVDAVLLVVGCDVAVTDQ